MIIHSIRANTDFKGRLLMSQSARMKLFFVGGAVAVVALSGMPLA